eukprot:Unigene15400_Nuclearia_a/m.46020 Unigene15400_Nuclearia_a/g.46020  ORF Unigene15400_Nuclearia_a/g.46020 Unigene15400_Nuclearia_a/m.46020 type:complete len:523 (+) Unigene15400_Nuclearia_a:5-1573(+)
MGLGQSLEAGSALTPEQLAKRGERRQRIAQELCETEESYVASMQAVAELYIAPLQGKGVAADDVACVFSKWQAILAYHARVFLAEFRARTHRWTPATTIGDVFVQHAEELRVYIDYVTNYDQANERWQTLRKTNRTFEQVLQEAKRSPRHTQIDLTGYLIMPVQRIPRYVLLLTELLKFTEPSHADFRLLTDAKARIERIASDINEAQRDKENMRALAALQAKIDGTFDQPLAQPHRRLLREGVLTLVAAERIPGSKPSSPKDGGAAPVPSSATFNFMSLFAGADARDEEDRSKPVYKGWMVKQGGRVKTWHKRFFVLNFHRLAYYEDDTTAKEKFKGLVEIDGSCRLLSEEERRKHGYGSADSPWIALQTPGRVYLLRAEDAASKDEVAKWEKALERVIASAVKAQKQSEDPKRPLGLTVGKTYTCLLLSDMLIFTTDKGRTYRLKGSLLFESAFSIQRGEGELVQLHGEQFLITLRAASAAEADAWTAALLGIIDELVRQEQARQQASPSFWKSLTSLFG